MTFTEQQIMQWSMSFIWPLLRISAMFISIPIFSGRFVSSNILVGASVAITLFTLESRTVWGWALLPC